MSVFDPRRLKRFNTPVEMRGGPPIGLSRDHLYPVWPELAAQQIETRAGTKPWYNRSVMHSRNPGSALGAQEAMNLAKARFANAMKLPVTNEQAEMILRYHVPQATPRDLPGIGARTVPFIPRSYIPAEAIKMRAALQNPSRVPGVRVVADDINARVAAADRAVMRKYKGGG